MARRSARVAERRGQRQRQSNPPFDPRILTLPGIAGVPGGLKRGKITSVIDAATAGAAVGWTLRFLYNPSTIELSHGLDPTSLDPTDLPEADGSAYYGQTQSTLSWSLLFDRTYETWDKAYSDKDAGKYGVYADVRALYGMLGMVAQRPINGLDLIVSPMLFRLVQVYFGGPNSLSYYGRIESISVQYTHWTTKMIPNRCVVGLAMSLYPKTPFTPGGSGSSDNPTGAGRGGGNPRTVPHAARAALEGN